MTYQQVLDTIKAALALRPQGTKVQVADHQAAEIAILDYIEQVKTLSAGALVREAHSSAAAGANCDLTWDVPFANTDYSYIINGHDSLGNPVEIMLVSRSAEKVVVKTLVGASLAALARAH